MERKPKTIFQLDSPFTSIEWPQVSAQDQDTILELLCSVLSPIGKYRSTHKTPSKGKRSKKRKRQEAKLEADFKPIMAPPPPEIASFIEVGLNSITRSLEISSRQTIPQMLVNSALQDSSAGETKAALEVTPSDPADGPLFESFQSPSTNNGTPIRVGSHFAAIFVLRPSQPSILHAHLPQLIATASLAHPGIPAAKLVQLPKGCDARICAALGHPRVSFIGISQGAPHSKPLIDVVRKVVPDVEIPWLHEAQSSKYMPLKVNSIETFSAARKKTQRPPSCLTLPD